MGLIDSVKALKITENLSINIEEQTLMILIIRREMCKTPHLVVVGSW
jgi:hypothetical protein